MHDQTANQNDPWTRLAIELHCLIRVLMPTVDHAPGRKFVAIILVTAWAVMTVAMTFQDIATVAPPYYGAFTAVVFLMIGRMWNLEVERLLPSGGGSDDD